MKKLKFKIGDKVAIRATEHCDLLATGAKYGIVVEISREDSTPCPYLVQVENSEAHWNDGWCAEAWIELSNVADSPVYKMLQDEI